MKSQLKRIVGVSLVAGSLTLGCSYFASDPESSVAAHFGEAQQANRRAMIAHPEAEQNVVPPTGLDPASAEVVRKNYEYSRQRQNQQDSVRSLVVPLD